MQQTEFYGRLSTLLVTFKDLADKTAAASSIGLNQYDIVVKAMADCGVGLDGHVLQRDAQLPSERLISHEVPDMMVIETKQERVRLVGDYGMRYTATLPLPAVLIDIDKAWELGYLHELLSPHVAEAAGVEIADDVTEKLGARRELELVR